MEKTIIMMDVLLGLLVVLAIVGGFLYGQKDISNTYEEFIDKYCICEYGPNLRLPDFMDPQWLPENSSNTTYTD